jgi:glutathione S-transferase
MGLDAQSVAIGIAGGIGIGVSIAFLRRARRHTVVAGQLWASPLTTCSRRAIAACVEAGAAFEFVPIHLAKGEHKLPQMLALQPYGKVPAWRDADGFDLFESRAIMRHVARGSALIPEGARERALMEQWLWVDQCYFYPAFITIYAMRVLKKIPLDEAKCAASRAELEPTLDAMEARLASSGSAYLACATFTLADLTFLCYFQVFGPSGLQDALDARPALAAWWARCSERPAWVYTMSQRYVEEHACVPDPLGRAQPWSP